MQSELCELQGCKAACEAPMRGIPSTHKVKSRPGAGQAEDSSAGSLHDMENFHKAVSAMLGAQTEHHDLPQRS